MNFCVFLIDQYDLILFVVKQITKTINNAPQTSNYEYVNLTNEKKSFEFAATESDRGGYGVHFFFVKNKNWVEPKYRF